MQRKQNTQHWGCPRDDRREAKGNWGALSMSSRRGRTVCVGNLIDRGLDKRNLYKV